MSVSASKNSVRRLLGRSCASCIGTLLLSGCATPPSSTDPTQSTAPPAVLFGELFEQVALSEAFPSKDWADAEPKRPVALINAAYAETRPLTRKEMQAFVDANFQLPQEQEVQNTCPAPAVRTMVQHIDAVWECLQRSEDATSVKGSLLPLPHPYIVPGGRFREVYYWDAYFTMVGLDESDLELKRSMVANFSHLIRTYGHIPNGNRSYYVSRSQPPFFFMMVDLLPQKEQAALLDDLIAEHDFWMEGAATLARGDAYRRIVRLADGSILSRFWDARDVPRDESFLEDYRTAYGSANKPELYRNLRAAAESGWDFSSRWFDDGRSLSTIETLDILPVDLNAILYGLERKIEDLCRSEGRTQCARRFAFAASDRRSAIQEYLWDPNQGVYTDREWTNEEQRRGVTAATIYPLFFGVPDPNQAARVSAIVREHLLAPGGLLTTTVVTGEQWDAPNGWAPLQWMAVRGLKRYGQEGLARDLASRWLQTISRTYASTGKMLEKYDVVNSLPGGGGEYPLQDGFGWTNGVALALLREYPEFGSLGETTYAK